MLKIPNNASGPDSALPSSMASRAAASATVSLFSMNPAGRVQSP